MEKVFHFDSPREKYHCDASIVGCFDNRFELASRKFLKRLGIVHADIIKVAGGAKNLASPDREEDRTFVLEQIQKSIRLHGTRRVIIWVHSDCGAYGGLLKGFQGDPQKEMLQHCSDLKCAAAFLGDAVPEVAVDCFRIDFEGVWKIKSFPSSRPPVSP